MMLRRVALFLILLGLASCATPPPPPPPPVQALQPPRPDRVIVLKSERRVLLMRGDEILQSFAMALGRNPVGPKHEEGDGRTPEGFYILLEKNPLSAYYRSIRLSYPNEADIAAARARGVAPGGQIMIHGLPPGWEPSQGLSVDWTEGCIAVTNQNMDLIWDQVALGTPIIIKP